MTAVKGGIAWTPVKVVTTLAIFVFAGLAGKHALLAPNLTVADAARALLSPKWGGVTSDKHDQKGMRWGLLHLVLASPVTLN